MSYIELSFLVLNKLKTFYFLIKRLYSAFYEIFYSRSKNNSYIDVNKNEYLSLNIQR